MVPACNCNKRCYQGQVWFGRKIKRRQKTFDRQRVSAFEGPLICERRKGKRRATADPVPEGVPKVWNATKAVAGEVPSARGPSFFAVSAVCLSVVDGDRREAL